MLHIGHTAQHGKHSFRRTGKTECPRGNTVIGPEALVLTDKMIVDLGKSSSKQGFHDYDRDATLFKFIVKIFGISVSRIHLLCMFPVDVIKLNLCEIPVNLPFILHLEKMVKYRDIAMI